MPAYCYDMNNKQALRIATIKAVAYFAALATAVLLVLNAPNFI